MARNPIPADARPIEVHPASMFDCENCGKENFIRCVTTFLSKEEAKKYLRQMGELEDYEETEDLTVIAQRTPRFIQCSTCKTWFRATISD